MAKKELIEQYHKFLATYHVQEVVLLDIRW